ncbi:hypothetical protein A2335_02110 [Candidatus Peregrinibacteria bacterium RIFOXYB2_FULL_32_7]|nr:MAG: hypothetical protein A2335_02110 [Candidatus Peregrinibacteria bacterium RIFOXYB2_FULL_32_7]
MHKFKNINLIIAVITIFLIIFAIFDYGLFGLSIKKSKTTFFFQNLDTEQITAVAILNSKKENIEINKIEDQWIISVNNYLADQDVIKNLLDTIKNLKSSEIVSKNANNFEKYSLGDNNSVQVKLKVKDEIKAKFYIGTQGPNFNSQFFRIPEENKVFLIEENLSSKFDKTTDDFRDKTIVNINSEEIENVKINNTEVIDLQSISAKLNPLKANGLIDAGDEVLQAETQDLGPFDIEIKLKNKIEPIILHIGAKSQDNNYFVTTNFTDQMYTVSSYIIDQLREIPNQQIEKETLRDS